MVCEAPEVSLNTHHPTGTTKITITVRLDEEEREGLIDRIMSQKTRLHSREQVVRALRLSGDEGCKVAEPAENVEDYEWEVTRS